MNNRSLRIRNNERKLPVTRWLVAQFNIAVMQGKHTLNKRDSRLGTAGQKQTNVGAVPPAVNDTK